MRLVYFFTIGFTVLALTAIWGGDSAARPVMVHSTATVVTSSEPAGAWFETMRPYCNPVQVETQHRWSPPPRGTAGASYSAACYALAGQIDEARARIQALEPDQQWRAAGIVFNIAHPVADAGNDVAAGPIMELVVEFWPNHYMALYHAGAARFALGEPQVAVPYLEAFLEHYDQNDGWTNAARSMLKEAR
ncbi:MAG: hypothetical protein OEO23_02860 [Gemmatimonadota bacterium]|nr:hypothetical protein [Gemmatimonadota bacterium]